MSWKTVRLGDLVDNFSVRAKENGGADGLEFYGVSNEVGIIKTKYAAEDKAEDYKIIEKGCFAYNPYRVNVGSIGLVIDDIKGLISPAYVVFKPKPNSIIPELLFKFLKSNEGLRQIKFYARGTVRQALRFEDLCNIEITIPIFEEQLTLYNKLIHSQEASNVLDAELKSQLELLNKLRQQLLKDAVQGKLVPQNPNDERASELLKKIKDEKAKLISNKKLKKEKDLPAIKPDEIPFEIPENWVWCKFSELTQEVKIGLEISKEYQSELNSTIYFKMNNIGNYSGEEDLSRIVRVNVTDENLSEYGLQFGDFLFNTRNSKELVGKTCIIKKSIYEPVVYNNNIARVRFINTNSFYINYWFTTNNCRDILFNLNSGITNVAAIYLKQLANLPVPLPPLDEQNRIVQKLNELMLCCNDLNASIKQSKSQNEKLLQQVLREALQSNIN